MPPQDPIRYDKVDKMLQLAMQMQASRGGLSLQDIEQRVGVGRRTAMRMRDSLLRIFPQAEEVETDERIKRWRIPPGVLNQLIAFSADELADLLSAVDLLKRDNLHTRAASVENIYAKLSALMKPDVARKVAPDLEALLEAEGLAMRPGPRPQFRETVIEDIRHAIKSCQKVAIQYRKRTTNRLNRRLVHPYGFLLGHRHYLVAFHEDPKANRFAIFSLPNIEEIEILDDMFERDPGFSLKEFAEQSFGIFQEKPLDVVWKFSAKAASNAKDFLFHPSQEQEELDDGSLIVRFKAGGTLEMAWHLYTWGDQVEVLEPKELADMVDGVRQSWPGLP